MEEELAPGVAVSAIVVSYNSKEALTRSLAALKASSLGEAMEILVVDCGSRDSSGQIDQEVSGVTVLRLPRHFGLTKARNIGARTAQGRFLLFLDPDIEVLPETVALLAARLDADPSVVIACPLLMDRDGRPASHIGDLPSLERLYQAWRLLVADTSRYRARQIRSARSRGDLNRCGRSAGDARTRPVFARHELL